MFNKEDIYEVFWLRVRLFIIWCADMYHVKAAIISVQLKRKIPSNCDLSCGSWSLGVSESLVIQVKKLLKNWPEDLETMLVRGISCHHKTIPFLVFDIFICQSHIIMLLEKHCPESWLIFFLQSNCLKNNDNQWIVAKLFWSVAHVICQAVSCHY